MRKSEPIAANSRLILTPMRTSRAMTGWQPSCHRPTISTPIRRRPASR